MKRGKNFYLYTIYTKINSGKSQKEIGDDLGFSKQRLKYYRDFLIKIGYIKKGEGYGSWKIIKNYDEQEVNNSLKQVKKTIRIETNQLEQVKKTKEVRGHGIRIKLILPEDYRNWEKRREIFDYLGIEWKPHFIGGIERGELIVLDETKIHLYHKSIEFHFDRKSFIENTSKESQNSAVLKFLKLVKKLERKFNNSPMSIFGKYKFKVTRQHYALVKNALAKQYIDKEKRLNVYSGRGLWLLIDNSFNLSELETVHPDTAVEDNEKVQTFFNEGIDKADLETIKETTPNKLKEYMLNSLKILSESAKQIKQNAENQGIYGENSVTHVKLMKNIDKNLKKQTEFFKDFLQIVKYFKDIKNTK